MVSLILPWILPPLLGAIIGYLTNALAIRMLFRPLRAWRLFGVRVPFTPGVIPRRRDELAESIGRMVSAELLTPEVFSQRFGSREFERTLRSTIVTFVDRLGATKVEDLRSRAFLDEAMLAAQSYLERRLCNGGADDSPLSSVVSDVLVEHADDIAGWLVDAVQERRVLRTVDAGRIDTLFDIAWPHLRRELEKILRSQTVQGELHFRARRVLTYSLDQLSSLQRLFVSAAQYDRQLGARIPAIVERITEEISLALDEPAMRSRIAEALFSWMDARREHTLAELIGRDGTARLRELIAGAISSRDVVEDALRSFLRSHADNGECRRLIRRGFDIVRSSLDRNADVPLATLVPELARRRASIGRWGAEKVRGVLATAAGAFVRQLDVYRVVVNRINDLDIERVEELILVIVKRHLTWINLFGALLGAVIGALQILLRVLGIT